MYIWALTSIYLDFMWEMDPKVVGGGAIVGPLLRGYSTTWHKVHPESYDMLHELLD